MPPAGRATAQQSDHPSCITQAAGIKRLSELRGIAARWRMYVRGFVQENPAALNNVDESLTAISEYAFRHPLGHTTFSRGVTADSSNPIACQITATVPEGGVAQARIPFFRRAYAIISPWAQDVLDNQRGETGRDILNHGNMRAVIIEMLELMRAGEDLECNMGAEEAKTDAVAICAWQYVRRAQAGDLLLVPSQDVHVWHFRLSSVCHTYHFTGEASFFRNFNANQEYIAKDPKPMIKELLAYLERKPHTIPQQWPNERKELASQLPEILNSAQDWVSEYCRSSQLFVLGMYNGKWVSHEFDTKRSPVEYVVAIVATSFQVPNFAWQLPQSWRHWFVILRHLAHQMMRDCPALDRWQVPADWPDERSVPHTLDSLESTDTVAIAAPSVSPTTAAPLHTATAPHQQVKLQYEIVNGPRGDLRVPWTDKDREKYTAKYYARRDDIRAPLFEEAERKANKQAELEITQMKNAVLEERYEMVPTPGANASGNKRKRRSDEEDLHFI